MLASALGTRVLPPRSSSPPATAASFEYPLKDYATASRSSPAAPAMSPPRTEPSVVGLRPRSSFPDARAMMSLPPSGSAVANSQPASVQMSSGVFAEDSQTFVPATSSQLVLGAMESSSVFIPNSGSSLLVSGSPAPNVASGRVPRQQAAVQPAPQQFTPMYSAPPAPSISMSQPMSMDFSSMAPGKVRRNSGSVPVVASTPPGTISMPLEPWTSVSLGQSTKERQELLPSRVSFTSKPVEVTVVSSIPPPELSPTVVRQVSPSPPRVATLSPAMSSPPESCNSLNAFVPVNNGEVDNLYEENRQLRERTVEVEVDRNSLQSQLLGLSLTNADLQRRIAVAEEPKAMIVQQVPVVVDVENPPWAPAPQPPPPTERAQPQTLAQAQLQAAQGHGSLYDMQLSRVVEPVALLPRGASNDSRSFQRLEDLPRSFQHSGSGSRVLSQPRGPPQTPPPEPIKPMPIQSQVQVPVQVVDPAPLPRSTWKPPAPVSRYNETCYCIVTRAAWLEAGRVCVHFEVVNDNALARLQDPKSSRLCWGNFQKVVDSSQFDVYDLERRIAGRLIFENVPAEAQLSFVYGFSGFSAVLVQPEAASLVPPAPVGPPAPPPGSTASSGVPHSFRGADAPPKPLPATDNDDEEDGSFITKDGYLAPAILSTPLIGIALILL